MRKKYYLTCDSVDNHYLFTEKPRFIKSNIPNFFYWARKRDGNGKAIGESYSLGVKNDNFPFIVKVNKPLSIYIDFEEREISIVREEERERGKMITVSEDLPVAVSLEETCNTYYVVKVKDIGNPILAMYAYDSDGKPDWYTSYVSKITGEVTHWLEVKE